MVWNTFGPISQSLLVVFCPEWDEATLALLGNWGNIMYLIPVVPVMWYFNTKGQAGFSAAIKESGFQKQ